jgi:hypothetical protein
MAQSACLKAVLEELHAAGVHHPVIAPGGKHVQIRWVNACGVARMFTAPSTPSDYRSVDNCRAEVRRILREDGMRPTAEPKAPPRQPSRVELLERRVAEIEWRLGISLAEIPNCGTAVLRRQVY